MEHIKHTLTKVNCSQLNQKYMQLERLSLQTVSYFPHVLCSDLLAAAQTDFFSAAPAAPASKPAAVEDFFGDVSFQSAPAPAPAAPAAAPAQVHFVFSSSTS
jgi:hypothetical protein